MCLVETPIVGWQALRNLKVLFAIASNDDPMVKEAHGFEGGTDATDAEPKTRKLSGEISSADDRAPTLAKIVPGVGTIVSASLGTESLLDLEGPSQSRRLLSPIALLRPTEPTERLRNRGLCCSFTVHFVQLDSRIANVAKAERTVFLQATPDDIHNSAWS
jgi:hypothetical protein